MRTIILILSISFLGCQAPKKREYDFTFFKWNIHESYYLKLNSTSDTLYYVNAYPPLEGQTSYMILNSEEKSQIEDKIDTISFPKESKFEERSIEDGETFAFILKRNNELNQIKIHGHAGPTQFWLLGKSLEEIKDSHQFKLINKRIEFSDVEKMFEVPPPPIIQK